MQVRVIEKWLKLAREKNERSNKTMKDFEFQLEKYFASDFLDTFYTFDNPFAHFPVFLFLNFNY